MSLSLLFSSRVIRIKGNKSGSSHPVRMDNLHALRTVAVWTQVHAFPKYTRVAFDLSIRARKHFWPLHKWPRVATCGPITELPNGNSLSLSRSFSLSIAQSDVTGP